MTGVINETNSVDVAVIGGGINGLVAAALLAHTGRSVVLLEAATQTGGVAPTAAQLACGLPTSLIRRLKLKKHGLSLLGSHVGRVALDLDGRHIPLGGKGRAARRATREAIFHWSSRDAEAWDGMTASLDRLSSALMPWVVGDAPHLHDLDRRQRFAWALQLFRLRRQGRVALQEVLQLLPSNVADFLDDRLETDILKGALALEATRTSQHGPRAPGSMLHWQWERALEQAGSAGTVQVAGGAKGLIAALRDAAMAAGADIRCSAPVTQLLIEDQTVLGVVLDHGEEIRARCVVSAIDPRSTYLDLVGARHLDAGLVNNLRHQRPGGALGRITLTLGRRPTIARLTDEMWARRLMLAPSVPEVERASNAAKYDDLPDHPVAEITVPSVLDRNGLADGRELLTALVPFLPQHPRQGWSKARDLLAARVVKQLSAYAPDLPDLIEDISILTPEDMDPAGVGLSSWHHLDLAPDQLMGFRPVAELGGHDRPIKGLILAGAGSHPGGGLNGRAAMRAVRDVLAEGRRERS